MTDAPNGESEPKTESSTVTGAKPSSKPGWFWALVGATVAVVIMIPFLFTLSRDKEPEQPTTNTIALDATTSTRPVGSTPCPDFVAAAVALQTFDGAPPLCLDPAKAYDAVFTTTSGDITMRLSTNAPNATNAFAFLIGYQYYNGGAMAPPLINGTFNVNFVVGSNQNDDVTAGFTVPIDSELPTTYRVGDVLLPVVSPMESGSRFAIIAAPGGQTIGMDSPVVATVTGGSDIVAAIANGQTGVQILSAQVIESQ